jgi:hypothetical protein
MEVAKVIRNHTSNSKFMIYELEQSWVYHQFFIFCIFYIVTHFRKPTFCIIESQSKSKMITCGERLGHLGKNEAKLLVGSDSVLSVDQK